MAKYRKLEGAARIKAFLLLKAGMNESATARACGASRDAVRRFHRSERFRRMDSGADMEALHAECKALRQENGFLIRALERWSVRRIRWAVCSPAGDFMIKPK